MFQKNIHFPQNDSFLPIVKPTPSTREGLCNYELPGTVSPSMTSYHEQLIIAKYLEFHRGKKKKTHTLALPPPPPSAWLGL